MSLHRRPRVRAMLTALCLVLPITAPAQEETPDQVGLVFPAFFTSGEDAAPRLGHSVAFALKLTVQSQLAMADPISGQGMYGRGITFYVPAEMSERSHDAAARLARINGLQGTIWGVAMPLIDGIALQSFLTLTEQFEDYRDNRQELWRTEVAGLPFQLGPPQQTVSFISETVPNELVANFGDPAEVDYCNAQTGCVRFPDAQITRVRSVADDGTAIIRRNRTDYSVQLPPSGIYTSEVVDYANLYIAYARGNLNQAIVLADLYIERHGPSGTMIDAHLYKAAALARTERFEEADAEIRAALELNPIARRSLRYGIMLELVRDLGPTERAEALFAQLEANYVLSDGFDEIYAKLR